MKLYILSILSLSILTTAMISLPQRASADSNRKHYGNSYYAHSNPHYGKVDSDGILSPGEIRNPLIKYNPNGYYNNNHKNDRHDCDYKSPYQNRPQGYGWQNFQYNKPAYNYNNNYKQIPPGGVSRPPHYSYR